MKELHEKVRKKLKIQVEKYKKKENNTRRDLQFKVGYLVLVYLRKERLPKGHPTKLMMKKIGPLKILYKYDNNAYEVKLPPNLGISQIFNVCDFFPYKGTHVDVDHHTLIDLEGVDYVQDLPTLQPLQLGNIMDSNMIKNIRKGTLKTYLVKWNGLPDGEAIWMTEVGILKHGVTIEDLLIQGT